MPARRHRFRAARPRGAAAAAPTPPAPSWQAVLRGLPHNVTTEMDLELWRLAQRIRADAEAARVAARAPPDRLAGALPRRHAAADAAARRAGVPGRLRAPRRRRDRPGRAALGRRPALRLRRARELPAAGRPGARAGRASSPQRRGGRGDGRRARPRGRADAAGSAALAGRVRARAGPAAGRAARAAQVPASSGRWPLRAPSIAAGRCAPGRGRAAGRSRRRLLPGPRRGHRGLDGADLRPLVAAPAREPTPRSCAAARVPRVLLSDGTEPEAAAPVPADVGGRAARHPASAGTVAGVARVVLDPLGARLDPGEILVAPSTDPGGRRCSSPPAAW